MREVKLKKFLQIFIFFTFHIFRFNLNMKILTETRKKGFENIPQSFLEYKLNAERLLTMQQQQRDEDERAEGFEKNYTEGNYIKNTNNNNNHQENEDYKMKYHPANATYTTNPSTHNQYTLNNMRSAKTSQFKQRLSKVNSKSNKLDFDIYVCRDFKHLNLKNLLPILKALAKGNELFQKMLNFLVMNDLHEEFSNCFPIKVNVPIGYSFKAKIQFYDFEFFESSDSLRLGSAKFGHSDSVESHRMRAEGQGIPDDVFFLPQ